MTPHQLTAEGTRRVQVLVAQEGDRRALLELLDGDVEVVLDDTLQPADCYLVGDRMVPQYRAELRRHKERAHPTFCPVLVLRRENTRLDVPSAGEQAGDDLPLVDDVVAAPVDRATLHRRLENLFVRRDQSLELSRRYEHAQTRLQRLFEATNDAIFVVALDEGEVTECNPAACDLVGQTREEVLTRSPGDLFQATGNESLGSFLRHVQQVGEGWTENLACVVDGDTRPVEVSGARLGDDEDSPVVLSARDVTERRQYEQDLELFRNAVEEAGHGVVITDADGNIEYVNPAYEQDTGYTRQEAVGRNPRIVKSGKHDDELYEELWETITSGELWEEKIVNRRKSGELFYIDQTIAPITDEAGTITHFVGIESDVTERQLRNQRLSVLNRVLRHNLRNSLTVIEGHVSLLQGALDDEDLRQSVDAIDRRANELTDLSESAATVRQLFEQYPDTDATCDVGTMLTELGPELEDRYPDAEITVDAPDSAVVNADERLAVAVREAVDNAVAHDDRPAPDVIISVESPERKSFSNWVEITIEDTGPGIPEHELDALERDREGALQHGTGLGLWIINWIVASFGGELQFHDREPRGTVVSLRLPRNTD